ncbi:hypothetical protein ACFSWE_06995 [Leucobacter albus]|uniref:Uncharacterized protein n=1 Tax=Leucobacter albus TaxID=272210 RepID=A0ABW3TIQ2_9MICO
MKFLKWLFWILLVVAFIELFIWKLLPVLQRLEWQTTWDIWAILTAIGTIGATVTSLVLAFRAWAQERKSAARLISAWITDDHVAKPDGSAYERKVQLHIANESNEPAFNAMASVHVGREHTPLGPLAAPSPISVIPPRREHVYDISVPLLAHSGAWLPKASLTFQDPSGKTWLRDVDGSLRNVSGKKQKWSKPRNEPDERQIGDQDSFFNPLTTVLTFLAGLRDPETDNDNLKVLLAEQAPGWNDVDLAAVQADLEGFQPTSMVDYQAPRIARVKLSGDRSLEGRYVVGDGKHIELQKLKFVTLTLHPEKGWQIFGIGDAVPTDRIHFGGSLNEEIKPYGG